jgi:Fe-S cluster assembly protein SufD
VTVDAGLLDEFGRGDARERAEAWRYSRNPLQALGRNEFAPADALRAPSAPLQAAFAWPQSARRRLVFVNGVLHGGLSDFDAAARIGVDRSDAATTLTFAQDDENVHLVWASVPETRPSRWSANLDIVVRARGIRIVEQHVADPGSDILGALRLQVDVANGAELQTTTVCDLSESASLYRRCTVAVADGAAHAHTHALFGGRFQRHDLDVVLAGAGARHEGRGLFALRGREHVDVHVDVKHACRDTISDLLWRGVADQRARGILHGAITVATGADGADARLQTKNLLLSAHAEIDAQPVLEIHADEVKASHGATVGQLDERALFYLRSRGLPAPIARRVLIAGFCREALAGLDSGDLRMRLDGALDARLPTA